METVYSMFGDRVLLEKIEEKVEEKKTEGGIVIPNQIEEKKLKSKQLFFGVVIQKGWDVLHLSINDIALFNIMNAQQVELNGKMYCIVEEKNILARVESEEEIQRIMKAINI